LYGWEPYLFALTVVFAVLIHFIKGRGRGRPKQSQVVPDPRLRYGQVVKQRPGRRLVAVTSRVIFGVEELIPLAQISTSLLERPNGTIRQHVVPLHRKTRSFAKRRTALDTQTQLFKSYYNLCRKHGALKGKTPGNVTRVSARSAGLKVSDESGVNQTKSDGAGCANDSVNDSAITARLATAILTI